MQQQFNNPQPTPSCCDFSFRVTLCRSGVIIDCGSGNLDIAAYEDSPYGNKDASNIKRTIGGLLFEIIKKLDNSPKTIDVKIYPTEQPQ